MARQNKNLTDVFPSKNKDEDVTVNSNINSVQKNVITKDEEKPLHSKGPDEQPDESSVRTVEQVKTDLLSMYEEKTKKQTVEDTHQRTTFLFRKDLSKRLDKLAKGKRGFKTMFLNKAVEALLDEMEK